MYTASLGKERNSIFISQWKRFLLKPIVMKDVARKIREVLDEH